MSKEEMVKSLDGILKSGEPEYDIYELSLHFAIPALVKGVALPIEDYIPEYCDAGSDKLFMSTLEAFGGEYLFNSNIFDPTSYCMMYNVDLIKELGLEDPITLYEKDEWDWQKFSEYASLATKDSDNDGVVDQYGIYSEPFALAGFLYANNGVIASNESDVLSSQNVIETMNFIDRLNHVDKSLKVLTDEEIRDVGTNQKVINDWANGKTLFRAVSNIYVAISLIRNYSSTDDFKVIPFPLGPSGDGSIYNPIFLCWNIIPKGTSKPDQVYQIYEEYINRDISLAEKKELSEKLSILSNKEIDMIMGINNKRTLDLGAFLGLESSLFNSILFEEVPVSDTIITYQEKLQEQINKMLQINNVEGSFSQIFN